MAAITLNVIVQGLLTGLVYGLMALGLSVIFGVMRVVNFAHGEFTVVGMYAAFVLFETLHVDPLLVLLPIAAAFFGIGYLLQRTLINPFIGRAEHEQFILLVGLATVLVNGLLLIFGPDARPINLPTASTATPSDRCFSTRSGFLRRSRQSRWQPRFSCSSDIPAPELPFAHVPII